MADKDSSAAKVNKQTYKQTKVNNNGQTTGSEMMIHGRQRLISCKGKQTNTLADYVAIGNLY